jgi:hypothetical protein
MTALILTPENLKRVKRGLRRALPDISSGHLTEALASAIGRQTHAAVQADFKAMDKNDPEIVLLDEANFFHRLAALGYKEEVSDAEDIFSWIGIPEDGHVLIDTSPISSFDIKYHSLRARAWRNMLVAAINAGIEQKQFSHRWFGAQDETSYLGRGTVYSFSFIADVPGLAWVGDAGWDELSIHVALWPTEKGSRWVKAMNAGFLAGDAYASGWLERRNGAWLQTYVKSLKCRRKYLRRVAEAAVRSNGFGDRGNIIV